jgi:hypothetical protein
MDKESKPEASTVVIPPDTPVLEIPLPTGKERCKMAAAERAAESMEHVVVTSAQGHAFTMEQGRLGMLEGKVGMREGLAHRIIGESGGGQTRSQQAAGKGGTPT